MRVGFSLSGLGFLTLTIAFVRLYKISSLLMKMVNLFPISKHNNLRLALLVAIWRDNMLGD
jgi:hypothetical protein